METENTKKPPIFFWDTRKPIPDNIALDEQVRQRLSPVVVEIIGLLGFPSFLEALRYQGTGAKVGDSVIKLLDLHLLTNGFADQLTQKGNVLFSSNSSGEYQSALAKALGLPDIARSQAGFNLTGRSASEALEEVMGRVWIASGYDFAFCLELYKQMLITVSTDMMDRYQEKGLIAKKVTHPIREAFEGVRKSKETEQKDKGETWEQRMERLYAEMAADSVQGSPEASESPPGQSSYKDKEVPQGYHIQVIQEGNEFIAWAETDNGQKVPGTEARNRKRGSARTWALSLLKQTLP